MNQMDNEVFTLSDYVATFRQRKLLLLGSAFIVMLLAITVAFTLPATYSSVGTILIEQQDVPEDLVQSTIRGYASERIQIVSQRVMSSEKLAPIIEKYQLYPAERAEGSTIRELADLLKRDTSLENVSAEISNPRGRAFYSTIAFTVAYDSSTPQTAKNVATELVNLYLQENARSRSEAATETSEFLAKRAAVLDQSLKDMENELSEFKEQYGDSLPELMRLNTDRLYASDQQIINLEREIRSLKDSRELLKSELAVLNPYASYGNSGDGLLTASQRLDALQREYVTLSSKYASGHPDLIRIRKEIELLTGGDAYVDREAIEAELLDKRAELNAAKQRYSDDHPDVVRLSQLVSELEQRRAESPNVSTTTRLKPTSTLFIQKQGSLTATENELQRTQEQLVELIAKRDEYERRLERSPDVERRYSAMMRDYQGKVQQFREIQDKRETAMLAESLETEEKGERFILIDPPRIPAEPISPNRTAILILGFVLAAGVGMGLAALADALDTTIRRSKDILDIFGTPPIASIMYVENGADIRRRRIHNALIAGSAVAGVAVVTIVIQVAG